MICMWPSKTCNWLPPGVSPEGVIKAFLPADSIFFPFSRNCGEMHQMINSWIESPSGIEYLDGIILFAVCIFVNALAMAQFGRFQKPRTDIVWLFCVVVIMPIEIYWTYPIRAFLVCLHIYTHTPSVARRSSCSFSLGSRFAKLVSVKISNGHSKYLEVLQHYQANPCHFTTGRSSLNHSP